MSAPATSHHRVRDLQASFHAFTRISQELERAYDRLRDQAAHIDVALAESNRKLQEKVVELDETSRHLEAVLGSLSEAVVVTDPEGRITLVNRAFEELAGQSQAELRGVAKDCLTDHQGRPLCAPDPETSGEPRALTGADGPRIVRSSCQAILGKDGQVLGRVETLVDETEQEVLRQELRQRETFSALGEMAAGIAHELRNPMSAIEGFASLLSRALPPDHPNCDAHARRIVRGVRKANAIISNLLCFARPETFRPRRNRLLPLFHTLQRAYAEQGEPGLTVEVQPPHPAGLEVCCDVALIERLLVNLIDNSRTALAGKGTIWVRAREQRGDVVLTVADDGPGIPDELRGRLFLPFVTGRPDGTGLGLAIVRRIVDLHQGRIDVQPRTEGGTVFTVHLPRQATRGAAHSPLTEEGTPA